MEKKSSSITATVEDFHYCSNKGFAHYTGEPFSQFYVPSFVGADL